MCLQWSASIQAPNTSPLQLGLLYNVLQHLARVVPAPHLHLSFKFLLAALHVLYQNNLKNFLVKMQEQLT